MSLPLSKIIYGTMSVAILIAVIFALFLFWALIYPERCKITIAKSLITLGDVQQISAAVEEYKTDNGVLPPDLGALVPHYLSTLENDSWGNAYRYVPTTDVELRVFSLGADGQKGGVGAAADFYRSTKSSELIESIYKPVWGCNS